MPNLEENINIDLKKRAYTLKQTEEFISPEEKGYIQKLKNNIAQSNQILKALKAQEALLKEPYLSQQVQSKNNLLIMRELKAENDLFVMRPIQERLKLLDEISKKLNNTKQDNKNSLFPEEKRLKQLQIENKEIENQIKNQKLLNLKSNKKKSNYNSSNNIFNILKCFTETMVIFDRFCQSVNNHRRTKY